MTRRAPLKRNSLVGLTEIAALIGASRQAAHKAAGRPDFPRPLDELASGPVWRRRDVDRWLEARTETTHNNDRGGQR